ncbi:MAG: hypothetical protein KTR32_29670 [Granulosicoccus sp.]|nr:hypothetical protein [Granulosicoccus sp.]
MIYPVFLHESLRRPAVAFIAMAFVLGGCNSSSKSPASLAAQAVDGYLVHSTVKCDGEESTETTGLAGHFTCPPATKLFEISGGIDVGFDELEDELGVLFLGNLKAPSSLPFVTPTSTLLVEMSKDESGEFDPLQFDAAVETLETVLGVDIDPAADATADLATIKRNAQIQNVINTFVDSTDDYDKVVVAFTRSITSAQDSSQSIDLVSGVNDLMSSMNTELIEIDQNVAKDPISISALAAAISATNYQITLAQGKSGVTEAANQPASSGQMMTINHDEVEVFLGNDGGQMNAFSMADFESDLKDANGMFMVKASELVDTIGFDRSALTIDASVTNQPIELGFELQATDTADSRKLSVTTEAILTMSEGDSASIEVYVPSGIVMSVTAVDGDGTRTDASFTVSGERTFSSSNGFVSINLDDIEQRLADKGITGFLDRAGNYQITLVVGGVLIAEKVENVSVLLNPYTVITDGMTVNGKGFRGYASFIDE